MEKYLGNKRVLLDDIYSFTKKNCPDATSLFDVFSGTTNVARFFSKNQYNVVSNDVNRFTFILANTYLKLSEYPKFSNLDLPECSDDELLFQKERFYQSAKKDRDTLFPLSEIDNIWTKFLPAVKVLSHLNRLDKKLKKDSYHIYDHYTVFGENSDFLSIRGTSGKRNYFSERNAVKIDNILNTLTAWRKNNLINQNELFILMTSLLEEIVLVANVNGTFHDFNRNKLWPNSLQEFKLKVPLTSVPKSKNSVLNLDAVDAASLAPQADILYIDPPYNFRQYSAYYHFLNFIAAYPFLDSVEDYLKNISFVRGQHPGDDFASDFCFKDKFMDALHKMIENSNCKYIIMSYYGGRNHWNHWSKNERPTDYGFQLLNEYFNDSKFFTTHSSASLTKLRQNYQSRVGEKKEIIDEYLFFAEKKVKKRKSTMVEEKKLFFSIPV